MSFTLDQFADALQARDGSGQPYVLIGGQAVNYWATRYLAKEPALADWQPFTSKDLDYRGGRDDVLRMAARFKRLPRFPHKKMMTAFAGAIPWPIGELTSSVEFIRQVPGATAAEIEKLAITHDFSGKLIRVIDPVSLLACKLDLALTADQTGRRDADHVRILMLCTRAFLRETLRGVSAGELPVRGWLGATERVLKLAESKLGRRAVQKLNLNWREAFPLLEIGASRNRPITRFRQQRWKVWLEKNMADK